MSVEPLLVEVLAGSTSSIGRSPDRAWLVQLRRGSRGVVVAIGLSRTCADDLAENISEVIGHADRPTDLP
jgi:hypothetical protein